MKIEGTREACAFLEEYPTECKKIILKALRESVKPISKHVRSAVPVDRWKKLVRVKAKESKLTGRLYAVAGMLDNMQLEQGKVREWTKAYWMNYGTLKRRDPGHKFDSAPRGKKSRNKEGQPSPEGKAAQHRNFYDKAVDGLDTDITNRFLNSIEKKHERLLNKIR